MKKQYKVLKNFNCNGVKKKAGESLSNEEREKIGSKFGKQLISDDFLQIESGIKDDDENEPDNPENEDESGEDENDQDDDENEPEMNLNEMDKSQLLSYAKDLGLDIHGRTSEEKIKEQIQDHLAG